MRSVEAAVEYVLMRDLEEDDRMSDSLGRVRRSQVVMLNGPGAIIDFRAGKHGGAAVSVVAAGLDDWDRMAPPAGLMNPQRVSEPRLEKKLDVRGFRLPPVSEPPPARPSRTRTGRSSRPPGSPSG